MIESVSHSSSGSGSTARAPIADLAERLAVAHHVPPSADDRTVLAGAGGRAATLQELQSFLAAEQLRIADAGLER